MRTDPTFAELGEDTLVARILARIPDAAHVEIGPGDDAAVSQSPGRLVSSADMLVEGEDFLAGWLDAHRLGVKAAAQNLADIRAMGARPTGLLLSLAAPGSTPASFVDGLVEGLVEEAGRAGAALLGGDLSDAGQIVIAVTAFGSLPDDRAPLTRGAAQPGFDILLGGRTGWAAAGLDVLLQADGSVDAALADAAHGGSAEGGATPVVEQAIEAQRAPRPDYPVIDALQEALEALADQAQGPVRAAAIDLSDGLGSDAGRLARASGVVVDLDSRALDRLAEPLVPVAALLRERAGAREADRTPEALRSLARRWVLMGGEDHGFLAAVPAGVHPLGWVRIGRVRAVPADSSAPDLHERRTPGPDVLIDGVPLASTGFAAVDPEGGFRHFSGTGE